MGETINWRLVSLSFFSLFCVGLADNGRASIYPDILHSLGITYEQGSLLFSISSLTGLISTMSAKFWLRKFGVIIPQRLFSFLLIIACTILGFSFSYFPSYSLALFGICILGITMGGLSITMNLSIDQAVPSQHRRKFLSGLHSIYGLSSAFAPVLVLLLTKSGFSYQELYFVIALFPVFLCILSLTTQRFSPEEIEAISAAQIETAPISRRAILLAACILSFYVCSEVLLSSRFVIICRALFDLSKEDAQSYLSLFFISLTLGRFSFAFVHTQLSNLLLLYISIFSSLSLFLFGILYGPFFFSMIGLSMSIFVPCLLDFIAFQFGKNFQEVLPTIINISTVQLIAMHFFSGVLEERIGPEMIIYFSMSLLICSVLSLLYQSRIAK